MKKILNYVNNTHKLMAVWVTGQHMLWRKAGLGSREV